MAWYTDTGSRTCTRTYPRKTAAAEDARAAASHGWRIDAQEQSEAPDALWTAYTPMGTSIARTRPRTEVVVTYVRTDDWPAHHERAEPAGPPRA